MPAARSRTVRVTSPVIEIRPASLAPLPRSFYGRNPKPVARQLLGKILVRKILVRRSGTEFLAGRIVETEAYLGLNDPAAHSAAGHTPRNSVLFGPPGYAYVYFIYGNHYCLNVSCEPEGKAGGVLFRAVEPLIGLQQMAHARGIELNSLSDVRLLTSGPGRLAQAFGITRSRDNGVDLTRTDGGLWIADDGFHPVKIQATPRIGITKASDQLLRFILPGNRFVSGPRYRAT
ncbi:MAG TPA: DNA-3-methyladenine glycosylase [Candidatus Binatia bacterium]|nr:DNA-3-methyladenine glycosylase [Candidatus Binatia bacterium]